MSTFTSRLDEIADQQINPATVLAEMDFADLTGVLEARFSPEDFARLDYLGHGRSRRAGDVCGVLALSRDIADQLHRLGVPYIYAVEHGDTRDFTALKHCAGFITPNPAPTAFAPVQAVSEDRPTLVGLGATLHTDPAAPRPVSVEHGERTHPLGRHPARRLVFPGTAGKDQPAVDEGDWICLSGTEATVRRGRLEPELSPVARFHQLIEAIIDDAVTSGHADHPADALTGIDRCPAYPEHASKLAELVNHPTVRGFEELRRLALAAPLAVRATAHTPIAVVRARLFTGRITTEPPYIEPSHVGVGLLRDERMWSSLEERELLQLVFLGPQVLDPGTYAQVHARYLAEHGDRLYRVLTACHGSMAIARTPCMPIVKIFPEDFDTNRFAARHGLDPHRVRGAVADTADEQDVYHGWRGMRVFSQRPDIAELWLRAVLGGARRSHETGRPLQLRLLLATITLPAEAEQFLTLLDTVAEDVLGDQLDDILHGVSIMVETTGAYINLEQFFAARGRRARVDGAMIGSNDFTASLLDFNREDAPRTVIPGYVDAGLLAHSPFEQLELTVVGPSILSSLRRARWSPDTAPIQTWGFGGELAGDWETVRWLATHAEPLGLSYVTTAPRNMLPAAFAAAQAVIREDRHH
ncbi:MAG: putative PEP-binding protein [Pseudonocardiaceae bacterium]